MCGVRNESGRGEAGECLIKEMIQADEAKYAPGYRRG